MAGPRSSGKSTFIEWCKTVSHSHEIPLQFAALSNFDEPVYFAELGRFAEIFHQKLLVHVDIFTPFTDLLMPTEAALLDALSVERFLDYRSTPYLRKANHIYVFTLRVARKTVLRRLLQRCVRQNSELMRTLLAQIYSDVYGEAPFEQIYTVWDEVASTLPNVKLCNVVEKNSDDYRILC